MGVKKINSLNEKFSEVFAKWINEKNTIDFVPEHSTEAIIDSLMQRCKYKQEPAIDMPYPGLAF